ncbi:flagellar protein FliO/FliZ [Salinibacillus kushneri]|uniref:Flagellar protein FliO/FliZ n=1 Tax=Salinibacillus kushneri TaxID=237682 RepID=A0A1I0E854_9BACI|nr:flagellar biosynthetic protein FliO [Salinibacillus kushneri]SET41351.1 flagellar protein FliO/FliZ [Salinibacillus kushneri]
MNKLVRLIVTSLLSVFVLMVQPNYFIYAQTDMNVDEFFEQKQNDKQIKQEENQKTTNDEESTLQKDNGSLMGNIIKMVFMLAVVLALIYFLLRFLQKRNKMFQQVRAMENLGGISLGSNKSMQMVRIGDRIFVVGVGEDISLLTEIDDEATKEDILQEDDDKNTNQPFKSIIHSLDQIKDQRKKGNPAKSFKEQFSNEMKKLKRERNQLIDHKGYRKEDQDG